MGVTPSVAAPGDTNTRDATVAIRTRMPSIDDEYRLVKMTKLKLTKT